MRTTGYFPLQHRSRRRNPGYTAAQIAAVARSASMDDLAGLLEMGGDMADQLVAAINDALSEPAAPPVQAGPLSDREAWRQLAALVPTALHDQPKALQDALVAEFLAEAQRAA